MRPSRRRRWMRHAIARRGGPRTSAWPPERRGQRSRGAGGMATRRTGGPSPGGGWPRRRGGIARRFGCFFVAHGDPHRLRRRAGAVAAREPPRPGRSRARSPTSPGRRASSCSSPGSSRSSSASGSRGASAAPLTELVDAAGRIEAADYSVRVEEPERGPGELQARLARSTRWPPGSNREDATRRRLLADVSHELRTPLAVIQGNLEALLDGVYPAGRGAPRARSSRRRA